MQIVIDIDEKDYNKVRHCLYGNGYNYIEQAKLTKNVILSVFNGTPLKAGKWIKIGAYQGECSCCNNRVIDEDEDFGDYCRWCGAEMESD